MSDVFPVVGLLKISKTAVRYRIESFFSHIPCFRFFFSFLRFFIKPIAELPEEANDRLEIAYQKFDLFFQEFMRFSAIYPDKTGLAFTRAILSEAEPEFIAEGKELEAVISYDFPAKTEKFFQKDRPDMVLSLSMEENFKDGIGVLECIFDKNEQCERLEAFKKYVKSLDLRQFADTLEIIKQNFSHDEGIFFPEIDWLKTSKHLLTYVPVQTKPLVITRDVSCLLAKMMVNMILRDGLFLVLNGDNLKSTIDGDIVIGAQAHMIKLTAQMRQVVFMLARAMRHKNVALAVDTLISAGYLKITTGKEILIQQIKTLTEEFAEEPFSKKCALLMIFLGKEGLSLPVEIRWIYGVLFGLEKISNDVLIWSKVENEIDFYINQPQIPIQKQENKEDVVKETRNDFLRVPEVAKSMTMQTTATNASFVENPKKIARILQKNQDE